jgi:Na+-translocating ferredoxin:NAD+ oxidoreductase subunit C
MNKMPNLNIPEHKEVARKTPIEVFPDPKTAIVLTNQHTGKPNIPSVQVGDTVAIGQKIADSKEKISAPVHSPISGKVIKIGNIYNHSTEKYSEAIFIENDDKKIKAKTLQPIAEAELEKTPNEVLLKIIREAGIIGLGGAGFPTHIKLSPPTGFPIKNLVINASESEPYDTADERLLIEKTDNLARGIWVIRKILGNPKVTIATDVSKTEAVSKLQTAFANEPDTKVFAGHICFQQGDASSLQKKLFSYEPSPDKRSYEMGTIVQNVATVNAIANAVFEGEPLISRVTALNGDVAQAKNLQVKIGTLISDILNKNNVNTKDLRCVVVGGVMMGHSIPTVQSPVTKRTSSIIIFAKSKHNPSKPEMACIHCSECIRSCPAKLHPILIYNALKKGNIKKAQDLWINDCIACGICSYVCPSGIPLANVIATSRH